LRITITGLHLIRDRTIKAHEAGVGALERPLVFYDLWDLHGVPLRMLARRTWKSLFADRVPGHAAELGFYFFFAVFPALFCASSLLGLAAHSADQFFARLLDYLALVIPKPALGTVLHTFVQITANATTGKVTFGFVGALWSASVGIVAIQDTLNVVYKIRDSRSYFQARFYAIALTIILFVVVTLILACLFGATFVAAVAHRDIRVPLLAQAAAVGARIIGWFLATVLLALSFALIYHCAPDTKDRRFQLITPGTAFGILGWLVASLGLRIYLHYFDTFPVTYGSLGAVIILLTWFYITGLMILLGAEINSGIEAATEETRSADSPVSTTEMQTRMNDSQKSIEGP
jgi:membrane protein